MYSLRCVKQHTALPDLLGFSQAICSNSSNNDNDDDDDNNNNNNNDDNNNKNNKIMIKNPHAPVLNMYHEAGSNHN